MNPRKPDLYQKQEHELLKPVEAKPQQLVTETIMSVPTPEGQIATLHLPAYMTGFLLDINRMNEMYKMPEVRNNVVAFAERLRDFQSILEEECKEITQLFPTTVQEEVDMLQVRDDIKIGLADLLGDIIVYCASEAKRWGIPIDRVLNIIMQSNFSKLDENGQPIYDERMKLLKGPGYWKPEPKIAELLASVNGEQNV